ncbi:DNA-binding protein [Gemmobacter aquarius]|uniref:DNA-binding protein n=1 Tax=Paragemmobacter aquarius TaxID=2169400 RepID=A0A2S0UK39_9RHOB|nr:DNA-binding protein [Gemmobacter aquarius]
MPKHPDSSPTSLERLMTIPDAAEYVRVSTKTIRRWISRGDLPAAKLGFQWRIRPQDLARFVRDRLEE